MTLRIDRDQLLSDLEHLSVIGRDPSTGGITRRALSKEDADARRYVAKRMRDAGLEVRHDEVGNLRGLRRGADPNAATVVTGSHLDTVPSGGKLDGPLGVVGAVAALQAIDEIDWEQPFKRNIEIVVFVGEEGSRFPRGTIGSAAVAGHVAVDAILALKDSDGIRYADALATYGDEGKAIAARANPGQLHAFVELHIEQGGILESTGTHIGAVTAISGLVQRQISFFGDANHAGTTPMHLRRDALIAASEWALAIERAAREIGGGAVGTIGKLEVSPGGKNIIPGRVDAICDLRASTPALLSALDDYVVSALHGIGEKRGIEVEQRLLQRVEPGPMAESAIATVEAASTAVGLSCQRMVSGAIHDALHMAEACPSTMIFVPSIRGKSHCPEEDSSGEALERGCIVLAETLARLAT